MVARKSIGVALLGAAAAQAQTVPSIPINAQAGLLNIPITCKILGFGDQTFNTQITATAPIYGGSGQQIYYSDVTLDITVPTNIVSLVSTLGAKSANADMTVNLNIANGIPSSIQAFQATSANFTVNSGSVGHLLVPAQPPIGPVTLVGLAGAVQRITLGDITVNFNMFDSNGNTVLFPISTTCGQQNVDFVIGSVLINGTRNLAPYAPSLGGSALSFPTTPLGSESGGFHIPYNCVFGPLGSQSLDLVLTGTVPLYAAPSAGISLTNGQAFLKVPAATVHVAKIGWPKTTAFRTTITSLQIDFNNASPPTYEGASTPIVTTTSIGDGTADVIIPIPNTSAFGSKLLTLGPVRAGSANTVASFQVGNVTAQTDLVDFFGNVQYSLPVTCYDPNSLDLAGILITTATPASASFL